MPPQYLLSEATLQIKVEYPLLNHFFKQLLLLQAKMLRVRQLIDSLTKEQAAALKKLLPPASKIKCPSVEELPYPSILLSKINTPHKYSIIGLVSEELLTIPSPSLTHLLTAINRHYPLTQPDVDSITKSVTIPPFLAALQATRTDLLTKARGSLLYNQVLTGTHLEGHPDILTADQIFEVKMTGDLKKNWAYFLFQLFSYASLSSVAKDAYLILPLQQIIWHFPLAQWTKKSEFKEFLEQTASQLPQQLASTQQKQVEAMLLFSLYPIGRHVQKLKSLPLTIRSLPSFTRPYQIFLSGNMNTKLNIAEEELQQTGSLVQQSGASLFIHSPYIINLCMQPGTNDDYHTKLLIKNLEYGAKAGAKGVVVHVGKTTDQDPEVAQTYMLENLQTALEHATPSCPLLLETPAGQGTECLKTYEEFVTLVKAFNDPRLRICVDTCHIFACGHEPTSYISRILQTDRDLLKLVHYNDSSTPCGSCVDRHACPGLGHIGLETMTQVAEICSKAGVPMLYE